MSKPFYLNLLNNVKKIIKNKRPCESDCKTEGLTNKEIFEKIYDERQWGNSTDMTRRYFSGAGSHDYLLVENYIQIVTRFIQSLPEKPTVADLGCGDFNVGSKIAPFTQTYTACDIASNVIRENQKIFNLPNVKFLTLDITRDELPRVDLILLRQVLQHLDNEQIKNFVGVISDKCRYLILTEHLPADPRFIANKPKPTGADIRLLDQSGVDLAAPPFSLKFASSRVLSEKSCFGGVIRNTLFEFF